MVTLLKKLLADDTRGRKFNNGIDLHYNSQAIIRQDAWSEFGTTVCLTFVPCIGCK